MAMTKNQALVLETLTAAEAPLSAYTILDKLRDHGFRAPLQVYRALDKLVERGQVHRLESLNAFVACRHEHGHDHGAHAASVIAFTICEDCGQVAEIHDHAVEERLATLAAIRHFKTEKTTIEMRGHCENCTV
ncbi:Fur family transcriptional regulator [Rhizobium sp. CC-YZS058]|uniref:Fur family transcriptional regulator n=1 Tax=Rhizobium sp. CC-YZS058 TaxID=3042153 RepID=UPI002B055D3A|nr:Fur family transcriptional regulator [Rhizobium sp. CC-YZS058]MEA3534663.1 Fur family transcriptional regulator [Rhizobium sp. CC-YZS058]